MEKEGLPHYLVPTFHKGEGNIEFHFSHFL